MKKVISFVLCLLLIIPHTAVSFLSYAATYSSAQIKSEIESVITYKIKSEGVSSVEKLVSDTLPSQAGIGAEWYALSLIQYNSSLDFSKYRAALEKYVSSGSGNPTEKEKYALLLAASGYNGDYITDVIEECTGKLGIMSYIFSLHLLNLDYKAKSVTKASVISEILSRQLSDGGWAVSGNYGDVDTTSMALQALSVNMKSGDVSSAAEKALSFLSSRLNNSCEYSSYGAINSESTSQTIIALSALSVDLVNDSRFIKGNKTLIDTLLSYKQPDGSFAHIKEKGGNSYATVQALMALVSYYRFLNNKGSLYKLSINHSAPLTTKAPSTTKPQTTKAPSTTKPQTTKAPSTTKPQTTKAPSATKPQTTKVPSTTKTAQSSTGGYKGLGNIFGLLSSLTTEKTTAVSSAVQATSEAITSEVTASEVSSTAETSVTALTELTAASSTVQKASTEAITQSEIDPTSSEAFISSSDVSDKVSFSVTETSSAEITSQENVTAEYKSENEGSSPSYIIIAAALIIVMVISAVVIIKKRH